MVQEAVVEQIVGPDGAVEFKITPPTSPDHPAYRIVTVADIEAIEDVLEAILPIPEWGPDAAVKVRQFTKEEEFAMRAEARVGKDIDRERLEMLLVVHGVVDPPLTEEHVGLLRSKSQSSIDRILKKVTALNGGTEEAAAAAERRFSDGQ